MTAKLICWDALVMIDWLTGENPKRMPAIDAVVGEIMAGKCRLVVSTLLYVEVLESHYKMPEGVIEKFDSFVNDRNKVTVIALNLNVAKKAQAIRNHYHHKGTKISTPDAIHVATAIISESSVFHTFDGDLLKQNGDDGVDNIAITECTIAGMTMSVFGANTSGENH